MTIMFIPLSCPNSCPPLSSQVEQSETNSSEHFESQYTLFFHPFLTFPTPSWELKVRMNL